MTVPAARKLLPVVEWAAGPIGRLIDAAWINSPVAAALEDVLLRGGGAGASSKASTSADRLRALRVSGATADSSPLECEYAALFEPVREARAAALAFCSVPGELPSLHGVDLA